MNGVSKILHKFSSKTHIEIVVLNIEIELLKALSLMELSTIENDIAILTNKYKQIQ